MVGKNYFYSIGNERIRFLRKIFLNVSISLSLLSFILFKHYIPIPITIYNSIIVLVIYIGLRNWYKNKKKEKIKIYGFGIKKLSILDIAILLP
jgi:hypothetical protein